ncbi:hypothetical protein NL676_037918 [Syzygium grande]|nr:hypothetical protein NL676_037918 [Syzygium grande]
MPEPIDLSLLPLYLSTPATPTLQSHCYPKVASTPSLSRTRGLDGDERDSRFGAPPLDLAATKACHRQRGSCSSSSSDEASLKLLENIHERF